MDLTEFTKFTVIDQQGFHRIGHFRTSRIDSHISLVTPNETVNFVQMASGQEYRVKENAYGKERPVKEKADEQPSETA